MHIYGRELTRAEIEKLVGNLAQIGGTKHFEYTSGRAKGVSAIEVNTGAGLTFTVIPDRGFDIESCYYRGINLVYKTPNGITNPGFYEPYGLGWLHTFFGGLLTTCGLTYFGPPGKDGDEELGLHGRYSTIPADKICDASRWEGDEYIVELKGTVDECVLFGEKLRLTRTIRTTLGSKTLKINDTIENYGFKESPLTVLYHMNMGFPLLDEGSILCISSKEVDPYTKWAEEGMDKHRLFTGPIPGFEEQNYLHTMVGDENGFGYAGMINEKLGGGLGLYLKVKINSLPYISEWKMMGEKDYVVGIEPCNTRIENRAELRKNKRLPLIKPGETLETEIEVGILEGKEEINNFCKMVSEIIEKS